MALDPQFRLLLDRMASMDAPSLSAGTADEARANYRTLAMARHSADYQPEAVAEVTDDHITGLHGPVPIRIYRPEGSGDLPVVTYLHGGGWVVGDIETHDPVCRRVANTLGAVIVSVGYRLAPEHPHPGPLDDAMAVVRWSAATFPGVAQGVGGDSAGAALAAGAAMRAAREGIELAGQFLAYPAVDPTMSSPSIERNGTGYFLAARDMAWFYRQYLPTAEAAADPEVALLGALVPVGLAPAVILTAEYDPLHDEGVAYAEHLRAAGVEVRHVEGDGLVHGFLAFLGVVDAAERCGVAGLRAFATLLAASAP